MIPLGLAGLRLHFLCHRRIVRISSFLMSVLFGAIHGGIYTKMSLIVFFFAFFFFFSFFSFLLQWCICVCTLCPMIMHIVPYDYAHCALWWFIVCQIFLAVKAQLESWTSALCYIVPISCNVESSSLLLILMNQMISISSCALNAVYWKLYIALFVVLSSWLLKVFCLIDCSTF